MHKHFRVKQWVKACAGIHSCLSFIQRSKIVILWGRSPAPGRGVLQEQGRGCEQFGQRPHAAEDIFTCFITQLPCGLRNWHRLLHHHLCALILGQSEGVVASFRNEQWWRPTQVSQSYVFSSYKSTYYRHFHYYPSLSLSLFPHRNNTFFLALKTQSFWEMCYMSTVWQA